MPISVIRNGRKFAPGLKSIEDATEIRRRVLLAFEEAEREAYAGGPTPPLNFVVIGAGATGVELAGAISDISRHYLEKEFRSIDPTRSRIILLEGGTARSSHLSGRSFRQRGEAVAANGC